MADISEKQFQEELTALEAELRRAIHDATEPTPDDSAEAKRQRREQAAADPFFFYSHYLPHLFDAPFTAAHATLEAKREANDRLLILAYRGWGKSTVETYAESLRALACGHSDFLILTSRTDQQTLPLVLQLKIEFEENRRLHQDFGKLAGGAIWQQEHFALTNGVEVRGLSLKGSSRGPRSLRNKRPDRWVMDDLQELEDAKNTEVIDSILGVITGTVLPAIRSKGAVVRVIGTRMSEDCAISRLQHEMKWPTFELPAENGQMGELADPHRHPAAFLAKQRKDMSTTPYNREYLHLAEGREGMVRRVWLKAFSLPELRGLPLVAAVFWDPAIRPGGGGDFKAIITRALHPDTGNYYRLRAFIRKDASPDEQCSEFCRQVRTLMQRPDTIWACGYEANGFQVLAEYPLEAARKAAGLPPLPTQQVVNTINKDIRVSALAPSFENGREFFDPEDSDQKLLADQWVLWPKRGRDGPDADRGAQQLIEGLMGGNAMGDFGETEAAGYDAGLS